MNQIENLSEVTKDQIHEVLINNNVDMIERLNKVSVHSGAIAIS